MADSLTLPPPVLEWSRGLASLSPGVVPCRGLRDQEWRETHGRLCAFVDRWGIQVHEAGSDTLRLYGVRREVKSHEGYPGWTIWCSGDPGGSG